MSIEYREQEPFFKPILINNNEQLINAFDKGLVSLYQNVFGGYPYFEKFEESEVKKTFQDYLAGNGLIFVLSENNKPIGFSAGTYLENCSPGLFYIAELGIDANYRQQGFGTLLTETLMTQAKTTYESLVAFLIRTTSINQPAISLYTKMGFVIVPSLSQEVIQTRQDGQILSDTRIFLVKSA